jgi:hypothetical protein
VYLISLVGAGLFCFWSYVFGLPYWQTARARTSMSEIEALERQAREIKDIGYSSKFICPINKFLEIAEKARRYEAMSPFLRDAAEREQQ